MKLKIIIPPKFSHRKEELMDFMRRYDPVLLLERFTSRKLKKKIIVRHKPIKMEAKFKNNIIYTDFNNKASYIWLCICHELAHIILENPAWYKNKDINKIIKKHKERISKYKYTFKDAIEQVLAILLQAACENKAEIRKLKWFEWESTFDYMGVKKLGKIFWKDWLEYLKNISKYKNINEWILKILKKIENYE